MLGNHPSLVLQTACLWHSLIGSEGKKFIGRVGVSTDGSGNATFTFKPTKKVAVGQKITATATDPRTAPGGVGGTSEFSKARKVVAA